MVKNTFYGLLFAVITWAGYLISYPSETNDELVYEGVFVENIIEHIEYMTRHDRTIGDVHHDFVQRYLSKTLNDMGMTVNKQRSLAFNNKNRTAAPIKNIIAKLPGKNPDSKDLMLLAHYDAAKFSATGAADDAAGVAVILEVVHAFIKQQKQPINDLIVLFTDAEEVGLLGAHAFINEQLQNHDVGLIINLEARGSSGPVMMWPETLGGNRAMIEAFQAAQVPMPVTTSLHYEIYKMLPNDTDMTPFNQRAGINGFNLAFIDDHFNYHTRLDDLNNLSLDTLAHQVIQLQALLAHFSQADLSALQSEQSLAYFSLPQFGILSYPVWFNAVLLLLIAVTTMTMARRINKTQSLKWLDALKACLPFTIAAVAGFAMSTLLLTLLRHYYPDIQDVLQGFPYQGHVIMACSLVSSGFLIMTLLARSHQHPTLQQLMLIVLSVLLLAVVCLKMPGAGILILPVLLATISLVLALHKPSWSEHVSPLLAVLAFVLAGHLLVNLPIAMGMNALPITAVVLAWLLALFRPIIADIKKWWHVLPLILLPVFYLFYHMHNHPGQTSSNPLPTSLSYLYDTDQEQGFFYQYDHINTEWSQAFFPNTQSVEDITRFRKTYKKPLLRLNQVDQPVALSPMPVTTKQSLLAAPNEAVKITFEAAQNAEILEIYTQQDITVKALSIDGRKALLDEHWKVRANGRVLRYYFDGKKRIEMTVTLDPADQIDWQIQSHAMDLINHPQLQVPQRPDDLTPKPFMATDNTVTVQSWTFGPDQ